MAKTTQPGTQGNQTSTIQTAIDTGREYLGSAATAVKENPVTAAAIGAGVVAAVAAGAYGVSQLRKGDGAADGSPTFDADALPDSVSSH